MCSISHENEVVNQNSSTQKQMKKSKCVEYWKFLCICAYSISIDTFKASIPRTLENLAGWVTELCTFDFYWILNFGFLWYSSFVINFLRFFKRYFWPTKILLLRYSQNNYQICLYKLNLMCKEFCYEIINISAVSQAVFCYY